MKATGQERPSVLRAARELGTSSAAIYPYVAGRDELPTGLIVAAYDALSSAAETQEAAVDREDLAGRWAAACGAVRGWALANPNEYALIYGTPVPGHIAPAATIAPAARVSSVLLGILRDITAGRLAPATAEDDVPPDDREALAPDAPSSGPRRPTPCFPTHTFHRNPQSRYGKRWLLPFRNLGPS